MTELAMRRRGMTLVPVDDVSAEEVSRLPMDKDVLVKARAPRNPKHHRLAWALAQRLADACDWLADREDAMEYLKIKARHIRLIHDPRTGQVHLIPKSISFAAMDQLRFSRLFDRMVWVVCNEIVPGLDDSDLRREIEAMCAPNERRAA